MAEETEQTEVQEPEYAEAWRPNPGDVITGELLEVKLIDPNNNGAYPCLTLQTPDGERAVHSFHKVLKSELARARPKNGDEITITYLGQKEGGKNGTYHAYRVRGGQGQEFDWDSQLPDHERVAQQASPRSEIPIQRDPVPQVTPAQTVPQAPVVPAHVPNADYDPNGPLPFLWQPMFEKPIQSFNPYD